MPKPNLGPLLKRCFLFSELKASQLKSIEKQIAIKHFKTGKVLYLEDAAVESLYLLQAGSVKLTKFMSDGREQILNIVKPDHLIGLEGLFLDKYTTTAEALTEATVLSIEKKALTELIKSDIQIAFKMMESLNDELETAKRMLLDLGLKTARERMASFLLSQISPADAEKKEEITLQLALSRKEIASVLGLTQETVIRILSDFNATHLIHLDGKMITVKNVKRLKMIAESE